MVPFFLMVSYRRVCELLMLQNTDGWMDRWTSLDWNISPLSLPDRGKNWGFNRHGEIRNSTFFQFFFFGSLEPGIFTEGYQVDRQYYGFPCRFAFVIFDHLSLSPPK